MTNKSQKKAMHRCRAAARGTVCVEVQAPKKDADLIRAVAQTLRGRGGEADVLRMTLINALSRAEAETAFDVFGSDLPDDIFAGVFDQPR